MNSSTLRLVLLISCAHALVHVYEHSFACVEQLVVSDASFDILASNETRVSGTLGNSLRLPFGIFALLAGWLGDRFGSKRLLIVYLVGCSAAAALAWYSPTLAIMYVSMFLLGSFASIYHPAGVSLISYCTTPENRPMALGYHGILGSLGIAAGPFLAGLILSTGATWQQYYLVLTVPGLLLAIGLYLRLSHEHIYDQSVKQNNSAGDSLEDKSHWASFVALIVIGSLAGFVYAAILNFLPRYLDNTGLGGYFPNTSQESLRNYLAGSVLLLGMIGQYMGGRLARPNTLEPLLALALFLAAPLVFWMGFAEGHAKIIVTSLFSPIFFMNQPLINTLIAKYVPRKHRSLCYGLSFTLGFGVGSFGPTFAGFTSNGVLKFGVLASLLCISSAISLFLWQFNSTFSDPSTRSKDAVE